MPMVPGLPANMPATLEEPSAGLADISLECDFSFLETVPPNSIGSVLTNTVYGGVLDSDLDWYTPLPELQDTAVFPSVGEKRECFYGKPYDLCLRDCGVFCDPLWNRNTPLLHNYSAYQMFNPQSEPPLPSNDPLSDHTYVTVGGYLDSEIKVTNSYESESLSGDSGDDEIVDVETVQEKVVPRVEVIKKRGRKPAQSLKSSPCKAAPLNRRMFTKKAKRLQQARPGRHYKWGKSSRETSSASSSDAEDGKRNNHNHMERQRRDDQKRMLQSLRVMVPSVKNNPKAPKVTILSEAAKYVTHLASWDNQIQQLKKKQKQLIRRLTELGVKEIRIP